MSAQTFKLGPFEVTAPLGSGAMGVVWQARHPGHPRPLAIKVLAERYVQTPHLRQAFCREVRAAASLEHQGVVTVHDYGEVSPQEARLSGALVPHSPYLVMDLIQGGALHRLRKRVQWPDLRDLLTTLLDALAHAHARGVIHRDLKPANILLDLHPESGEVLPRLTDFGIARAWEEGDALRSDEHEHPHGTPEYMAPEQLLGHWRDQGPWTDLYALGCVVWELVCHKRPFQAPGNLSASQRMEALRRPHLEGPVPPLQPQIQIPASLNRWVARLLQKDPAARFQSAAEAAWALHQVDRRALRRLQTISLPQVQAMPQAASLWEEGSEDTQHEIPAGGQRAPHPWPADLPPMPGTWRRQDPPPRRHLPGVGLGVYGLRALPMVGRQLERDTIWNALAEVRRTRQSQAVLLRGPAGIGKSTLAEWIYQRAQEVGAAEGLRATHAPTETPTHGLSSMLAHWLGSAGLPHHRVLARVQRAASWLRLEDPAQLQTLAQLASATTQGPQPSGAHAARTRSPRERYAALHQLALRASARRPLIIWLDDVQWGMDALGWVQHVLTSPQQGPILFLMTARDDALAERILEWSALTALMHLEPTTRLDLEPLTDQEHTQLIHNLLGLDRELAHQLHQRTGGNPQFVLSLVGDWVQRGLLRPSPEGFVLRDPARATFPDDLHRVWRARLERLLRAHPIDARPALELAAVLGQEVDQREWEQACRCAGAPMPPRLLENLTRGRLAQEERTGWRFTQGMLRESLLRLAGEQGRLAAHHLACAQMLLERPEHPTLAERLGRHLLAAQRPREALPHLLRAARQRIDADRWHAASALLDLHQETMELLDLPPASPHRLVHMEHRLRAAKRQNQVDQVRAWVNRLELHARHIQSTRHLALAARHRGWLAYQEHDLDSARAAYLEARALSSRRGDAVDCARCNLGLGDVAYYVPDLDSARQLYAQALAVLETAQQPGLLATALQSLGYVQARRGEREQAHDLQQRALVLIEEHGRPLQKASALNALAELERMAQDWTAAQAHYQRALALLISMDAPQAWLVRLNLAVALLLSGQARQARGLYQELQEHSWGDPRARNVLTAVSLVFAAQEGAVDRVATLRQQLLQHPDRGALEHGDLALLLEHAGDLIALASPQEAQQLYLVAMQQWALLGHGEKLAQLQRKLSEEATTGREPPA